MAEQSKKILIVTSGQPSLNPRAVKEADALFNAGYDVLMIYQFWNVWGTKLDEALLAGKKWKAIRVGGSPGKGVVPYWLTRIFHRSCQLLYRLTNGRMVAPELVVGRCTAWLTNEARRHRADLYIAHNLAALPAAVKAAKKFHSKSGFDAEDFHRNETTNDPASDDVKLKSAIEGLYIPQVNYLSVSSPGIGEAYRQIFPDIDPLVILNVFPLQKEIRLKETLAASKLKLLWFSQTIGPSRGLEDIFGALAQLNNDQIELHLLGDLPPASHSYLAGISAGIPGVHIHSPSAPDELFAFASQFDIGLALETGFCLNNELALSNKIFTYMQTGLAIIASDTSGQKQLMQSHPGAGKVYEKKNVTMLADIVKAYFDDRRQLLLAKKESRAAACRELNWEMESQLFLKKVNELID